MRLIRITRHKTGLQKVAADDSRRLTEMLEERGSVHVVTNEDLVVIKFDPKAHPRDHGKKLAAKGLGKYLLGYGEEIQIIQTEYTSAERLLTQGIRPLLAAAESKSQERLTPFLIGVPEDMFRRLARPVAKGKFLEDEGGNVSKEAQLLALLPNVTTPKTVDLESRFRGASPEADLVRRLIAIAGPKTAPVLIQGRTGTGKEIVARAIHDCSGHKGPFIPVNCGALPQTLFESELFGYEPGVFTDGLKEGMTEGMNE